MSPQSILVYIDQATSLRRGYSLRSPDDAACVEKFSLLLEGKEKYPCVLSELSAVLEQGIDLTWEDVYDYVNPFGDRRGDAFNSVWMFNLKSDMLFLMKKDRLCSARLSLCRAGRLTLADFKTLETSTPIFSSQNNPPEPYWEPKLYPSPRRRAFLGRLLRDFGHTWRHIIRRPMNAVTFKKLAYATVWISTMEFTIIERTGFEHVSTGGPYIQVIDLPNWETPKATLFQVGSSWVAFGQDIMEGIELVRHHLNSTQTLRDTDIVIYTILTLQQVFLCKAQGRHMQWTRAEPLFNNSNPTSDAAIDMIIWATNLTNVEPQPITINFLPIEIQDRIMSYATASSVASAKMGCELGLGSPFSWVDEGVKICIETAKRHRFESSPVESQIAFHGIMSGLSYKREFGYKAVHIYPSLAAPKTRN